MNISLLATLTQPRMAQDAEEARTLRSLPNYVCWYYSYGQLKFALTPVGRSMVAQSRTALEA